MPTHKQSAPELRDNAPTVGPQSPDLVTPEEYARLIAQRQFAQSFEGRQAQTLADLAVGGARGVYETAVDAATAARDPSLRNLGLLGADIAMLTVPIPGKLPKSWLNATGDVVRGDTIRFREAVFGGSYKKPKYLGDRKSGLYD